MRGGMHVRLLKREVVILKLIQLAWNYSRNTMKLASSHHEGSI